MSDWFEITTDPHDPTHVEMRRMTADEVVAAYRGRFRDYARALADMDRLKALAERISAWAATQPIAHTYTRLPRREKRRARKRKQR